MSLEQDIVQLIEITGLDRETAVTLLKINDNNLQQAINYHLESDNNDNADVIPVDNNGEPFRNNDEIFGLNCPTARDLTSGSSVSENASLPDFIAYGGVGSNSSELNTENDDNVRAPIPSRREQLILPEDDQFRYQYNGIATRKRRTAPATFSVCPFRNFAREAEELEQACNNQGLENGNGGDSITNSDENNIINRSELTNDQSERLNLYKNRAKRKRLEDLFRPPSDLLFTGTLQAARDHATNLNRWLVVNVQDNREFLSQILNRDIWPDKRIKDIISSYFVLWQISIDNPEGFRFKTFYRVQNFPYVCILDPRTGEDKAACDTSTPNLMFNQLTKFLDENLYGLDPLLLPHKKQPNKITATTTSQITSLDSNGECSVKISSYKNFKSSTSVFSHGISDRHNDLSDCIIVDDALSSTNSNSSKNKKQLKPPLLELSEEEQLNLAIKNSLKEKSCPKTTKKIYDSDDDDDDNDDNDSINSDSEYHQKNSENLTNKSEKLIDIADTANNDVRKNLPQQQIESNSKSFDHKIKIDNNESKETVNSIDSTKPNSLTEKDKSITKIQIRLPMGGRDSLELPSSTLLSAISVYLRDKYPEIAKNSYKLISPYPRQNILEMNDQLTLLEAKLHPSTILYLHQDD